jgi:hypothetical protein
MSFAADFDREVCPHLTRLAKVNGTFVACGLMSWSEAEDAIHRFAIERGALHLPPAVWEQLEDSITASLLREVRKADAIHAVCERGVA